MAQQRLIKQALACFDQGQFSEAQALIDQASQDKTLQLQASTWYYKGVVYEQLMRKNIALDIAGQYLEEALKAYQKTLTLTPEANQYHSFAQLNKQELWAYYLNRGVRYYKAEAFDRAIEAFAICKRIQPDDAHALLYTAIAAHQEEQYDLALAQYKAYLQLEKGKPAVYCGLASITANQLHKPEQAKSILDQALQAYPWDVGLLEAQHQLLLALKELGARKQQLKEQVTASPLNPLPHFQLGYFYEQANQLEVAATYYQQAVNLALQELAPICRLGIVYYNQAANIINEAVAMPDHDFQQTGEELTNQAEQYFRKALHSFKQARKLDRGNLFILKQLHVIYTRLHMPEKAQIIGDILKRKKGGFTVLQEAS